MGFVVTEHGVYPVPHRRMSLVCLSSSRAWQGLNEARGLRVSGEQLLRPMQEAAGWGRELVRAGELVIRSLGPSEAGRCQSST